MTQPRTTIEMNIEILGVTEVHLWKSCHPRVSLGYCNAVPPTVVFLLIFYWKY